jgi:hypothetical protein
VGGSIHAVNGKPLAPPADVLKRMDTQWIDGY